MAFASNVAIRGYSKGNLSQDWNAGGSYQLGYNNSLKYNYVVVIRFTLEKAAKSVSIPIKAAGSNKTSSSKTLSYELGPNPDVDASKTNILASEDSLGTFYFSSASATVTITLGRLPAGTYYLYIYASSDSVYTAETSMYQSNTVNSVTYEELLSLVYLDNGSELVAYEAYIDNGSGWDLDAAYLDNGASWDACG